MVNIEIVVAHPEKIISREIQLVDSLTVQAAIVSSNILENFPELPALHAFEKNGLSIGIFGKIVTLDSQVSAGDRIEIYFPLRQSAMEARLARARKKQTAS